MRTLDPTLNYAILAIAPRLFVVRDSAPETLRDIINSPGVIFAGASDGTIYGDPKINWAFRAWHDAVHIAHGFPFTPEGEAMTCERQCRDLETLFPLAPDRWRKIIRAEIIGQVEHFARHGVFPADQFALVQRILGA